MLARARAGGCAIPVGKCALFGSFARIAGNAGPAGPLNGVVRSFSRVVRVSAVDSPNLKIVHACEGDPGGKRQKASRVSEVVAG